MLLGLLPASAARSRCSASRRRAATRRRIGYVPAGPGPVRRPDRGREPELLGGRVRRPGRRRCRPADRGLAARIPVGRLPLGVQRRAAFAQALAHRPDLLILDEPTSGVDPLGRARLWETIRSAAEAGAGVLVTTHYMEEAGECDRLVIMADGRVVARGTPAEVDRRRDGDGGGDERLAGRVRAAGGRRGWTWTWPGAPCGCPAPARTRCASALGEPAPEPASVTAPATPGGAVLPAGGAQPGGGESARAAGRRVSTDD